MTDHTPEPDVERRVGFWNGWAIGMVCGFLFALVVIAVAGVAICG